MREVASDLFRLVQAESAILVRRLYPNNPARRNPDFVADMKFYRALAGGEARLRRDTSPAPNASH